jgi:hypothetical protein
MAIVVRDLESDVSIDAFDVSAEVVLDGVARRIADSFGLPLSNTDAVAWHPFGGDSSRLRKTTEVLAIDRLRSTLLVCMRGFLRGRRGGRAPRSRSAAQPRRLTAAQAAADRAVNSAQARASTSRYSAFEYR